jgi:hypothetical protein
VRLRLKPIARNGAPPPLLDDAVARLAPDETPARNQAESTTVPSILELRRFH